MGWIAAVWCAGYIWSTTGDNLGRCGTQYIRSYGRYCTDWSKIKPGDVIWRGHNKIDGSWSGHVGIYIDSKHVVHTSGSPINNVILDSFNKSFWNGFIVITKK